MASSTVLIVKSGTLNSLPTVSIVTRPFVTVLASLNVATLPCFFVMLVLPLPLLLLSLAPVTVTADMIAVRGDVRIKQLKSTSSRIPPRRKSSVATAEQRKGIRSYICARSGAGLSRCTDRKRTHALGWALGKEKRAVPRSGQRAWSCSEYYLPQHKIGRSRTSRRAEGPTKKRAAGQKFFRLRLSFTPRKKRKGWTDAYASGHVTARSRGRRLTYTAQLALQEREDLVCAGSRARGTAARRVASLGAKGQHASPRAVPNRQAQSPARSLDRPPAPASIRKAHAGSAAVLSGPAHPFLAARPH